jgi:hypothetical protein
VVEVVKAEVESEPVRLQRIPILVFELLGVEAVWGVERASERVLLCSGVAAAACA